MNAADDDDPATSETTTHATTGDVTHLLRAYGDGDSDAFDQLVPMLYDDLHKIARRYLRRGRGQTLEATGLINEAYLRLVDQRRSSWQDRAHFLAVAAIAMRQIVIDHARKKTAAKRGGGERPLTLDKVQIAVDEQAAQLLELDDALTQLSAVNERLTRVVECRFFAGLSEEETAAALDVSLRTVQRDWRRARAWLREALDGAVS